MYLTVVTNLILFLSLVVGIVLIIEHTYHEARDLFIDDDSYLNNY